MKVKITRTSDYYLLEDSAPISGAEKEGEEWFVEVHTAADVFELSVRSEEEIVISYKGDQPCAEVYNTHRE
jgi:hypothetical protein